MSLSYTCSGQCPGRIVGIINRDPSTSKIYWLHVDIVRVFYYWNWAIFCNIPVNGSVIFLRPVLNWNRLFLDKTQPVHLYPGFIGSGYLWVSPSRRPTPFKHSPSPGCILYELILRLISNFLSRKKEHDTVVMTVNYESFECSSQNLADGIIYYVSYPMKWCKSFLKSWASVCVMLHPAIYNYIEELNLCF